MEIIPPIDLDVSRYRTTVMDGSKKKCIQKLPMLCGRDMRRVEPIGPR